MKVSLLALVLFVGFQAWGATETTLVTVGNNKVSTQDFKRRLDEIKRQAMNPPTPEQFLEDMVRFEIGVQEAEKMKLQDDPLVKERFKQVLYNALLEKQIGGRVGDIKISEKEMRDFYQKNPELRLSHILIELKENASNEEREITRKRANEFLAEIKKAKRPFEDFVKLYSDDMATKEVGGDIGFQSRVTLSPVIYDAAMKMSTNEVRGLIETKFGFHIIKLLERRNFDLADKHQIRAALYDDKRARIFDDYFARVKKSYKVNVNKEALRSITK